MERNEVFKVKKSKFINIAVLIVLLVFLWLSINAIVFEVGISIVVIIGGINYINKIMSKIILTDKEIIYKSFFSTKKILLEDVMGVECKKRPFSRIIGGKMYETGVFSKMILVNENESLFYIDSIYEHSAHLWYLIFKDIYDKDIYISENVKEAYSLILKRDIGGY